MEAALRETFAPDPASVALARRFVARACRLLGVDEAATDTAVLLTSETVTNAFMHGRSEARVRVLQRAGCGVRVEVGDDNSRHPQQQPDDPAALDGRGVTLIAVAASRWGVRDEEIGKAVWFEVDG